MAEQHRDARTWWTDGFGWCILRPAQLHTRRSPAAACEVEREVAPRHLKSGEDNFVSVSCCRTGKGSFFQSRCPGRRRFQVGGETRDLREAKARQSGEKGLFSFSRRSVNRRREKKTTKRDNTAKKKPDKERRNKREKERSRNQGGERRGEEKEQDEKTEEGLGKPKGKERFESATEREKRLPPRFLYEEGRGHEKIPTNTMQTTGGRSRRKTKKKEFGMRRNRGERGMAFHSCEHW
ncbi:hypothetical protein TGVAND_248560 [Toxoplasma gondii VAND]|uniref:Uncharacterized protein n=1 Tax=Toxoplasma gondii VAND TaxID=933077 RepID=A0A086QHT3_TOXGO|nr:hypothetical protein TGVAND_248560 [Toxoplasma gondii VAND]